jgi:hypothetical protein
MLYNELKRIERLKKMLEYIAYGSLGLDAAIAVVTLISVNIYKKQLSQILLYLNYSLTVEVLISVVLFLALVVLSHYEKVIDGFAEIGFKIKLGMERNSKRRKR